MIYSSTQITYLNIASILKKYLSISTRLVFMPKQRNMNFISVKYLEYILSSFCLTMFNNKVKIIQDWLELKKVKDIQSFLGFANFYY